MANLSSAQRKYLRAQAHHLKPVVLIGKQGLSDEVVAKVDQELLAHELIKVKFLEFKEEKGPYVEELAGRTRSTLAGMIGHVAIFYREHPDPERRTVVLPR